MEKEPCKEKTIEECPPPKIISQMKLHLLPNIFAAFINLNTNVYELRAQKLFRDSRNNNNKIKKVWNKIKVENMAVTNFIQSTIFIDGNNTRPMEAIYLILEENDLSKLKVIFKI